MFFLFMVLLDQRWKQWSEDDEFLNSIPNIQMGSFSRKKLLANKNEISESTKRTDGVYKTKWKPKTLHQSVS